MCPSQFVLKLLILRNKAWQTFQKAFCISEGGLWSLRKWPWWSHCDVTRLSPVVLLCSMHWLSVQSAGTQLDSQEASDLCTAAQPLEVLRCTKHPVSPSSVISAKPADKWAVNRVNSGHMYRPVFNYLAVNPAKRSPSLHSTAAHPCLSVPLCSPHSAGLSPSAYI